MDEYIIILDRYDDLRRTLANIIRLARLKKVDSLGKVFYLRKIWAVGPSHIMMVYNLSRSHPRKESVPIAVFIKWYNDQQERSLFLRIENDGDGGILQVI